MGGPTVVQKTPRGLGTPGPRANPLGLRSRPRAPNPARRAPHHSQGPQPNGPHLPPTLRNRPRGSPPPRSAPADARPRPVLLCRSPPPPFSSSGYGHMPRATPLSAALGPQPCPRRLGSGLSTWAWASPPPGLRAGAQQADGGCGGPQAPSPTHLQLTVLVHSQVAGLQVLGTEAGVTTAPPSRARARAAPERGGTAGLPASLPGRVEYPPQAVCRRGTPSGVGPVAPQPGEVPPPGARTHPVDDAGSVDVLWGQRAVSGHWLRSPRSGRRGAPPSPAAPCPTFSPLSVW